VSAAPAATLGSHAAVVLAAMTDPRTYGDRPARVDVAETHCSWVFLAGERAYKMKKPVVLPFLDYGTPARRHDLCREEVVLNRRLAPTLYLGTVALVRRGERFALVPDSAATIDERIETAVEMRRFAEDDTLAAHVLARTATARDVERIGGVLARFHAAAAQPPDGGAATEALVAAMHTTAHDLAVAPAGLVGPRRVAALRRLLDAVMSARGAELAARTAGGLVRDGHGDLRAEHVLLTDPPQIVDCLEFDPALRIADVAVDLAFLVMDLEALGAPRLARRLIDGYRSAGGDPGDDALLAAFACFRALVRAKVAAVRAGQSGAGAARGTGEVLTLMALAERLAWRTRGPLVLVCCGPAASGKSTLAERLAAQSGVPHLSSDLVRKRLAGVPPTVRAPESAYAPAHTAATYRRLGELSADALAEHGGAIVDATFHDAASRRTFRRALGRRDAPLLFVECRAPESVLEARAVARGHRPGHVSDATVAVVRRQVAGWAPLDEVPRGHHLVVRTDRPAETVADTVLAWLDARLAAQPAPR
jgi:aminoglycoside phosphotransferase family enzyme/predicted kinase